MELTLLDRFVLLKSLPAEGSFATVKIVQDLRRALSPSEEEHKELEIVEDGPTLRWNPDKDVSKEIPIGEKANDIIVMSLRKLDQDGKLTEQHMSVYEKFIKAV